MNKEDKYRIICIFKHGTDKIIRFPATTEEKAIQHFDTYVATMTASIPNWKTVVKVLKLVSVATNEELKEMRP